MPRKLTTEEFIEKAKQVHGDKYDYSKVEYLNNDSKIKIICNSCFTEFSITPILLLSGYGCPYCKKTKKKEDFIRKSLNLFGNRYIYSKVDYINTSTKVDIVCPLHGDYTITPHDHLRGHGCPVCGKESSIKSIKLLLGKTTESFIKEANICHNYKYSYDEVEYLNKYTPVKIKCPIHGYFLQRPDHHLHGHGCPSCNNSNGEIRIREYLLSNQILYFSQKRFEDCKNKVSLPFDFYLPDYNLCIEYQGKQHYEPIEYFGGENSFEYLKKCDTLKKEWCSMSNNPDLLEIKYTDNIEETLDGYFNK